MTFKQLDIKLNRKEFIIEKDGLRVISKSIGSQSEEYVDFEDIGNKITREKSRLLIPLFISIMIFAWGTVLLIGKLNGGEYGEYVVEFYYASGLVFFLVFYFFGKNYLYLSHHRNTSHIQFLNNNPSQTKLMAFIDELQVAKKKRLLERYGEFDEDKTFDEHIHQLRWLKKNGYLNREEYNDRIQTIESEFIKPNDDDDVPKIGFRND